jgi:integrase
MAKAGNIRRRGRSWVVYLRVNGRQEQKSVRDYPASEGGSARARDEALLWLRQAQAKKIRGDFRAPVRKRFRDFAAEWLRDYAQPHVSARTFEAYEGALRNHLVPHFGDRLLTEITRKGIDAFVADWAAGGPWYQERVRAARQLEAERHSATLERVRVEEAARAEAEAREPRYIAPDDVPRRAVRIGNAPGTISNALTPFREMLGHAVEWGYLSANPAAGVKRPRVPRQEMHVLGVDEVGRMLEAADDEWRTLLLCAVTTGLRQGELLALRWGDVDWNSGRLWVRRSVDRRGRFKETKTAGSVRAVAITPTLAAALRRHQLASPFSAENELVFPSKTGGPLDGGNVRRRAFARALRRAGLPQIRFHDLRHSYASLLIAQGEHPKLIAEQLGHASVQITLDRYGHLMDQSYGDASERLEALLFGSSDTASANPEKTHAVEGFSRAG